MPIGHSFPEAMHDLKKSESIIIILNEDENKWGCFWIKIHTLPMRGSISGNTELCYVVQNNSEITAGLVELLEQQNASIFKTEIC